MANTTNTEKGATGRIVRIVGPVIDVEFPRDAMPAKMPVSTMQSGL